MAKKAFDVQQAQKTDTEIAAAKKTIEGDEKAKMQAAIQKAGKSGEELTSLQTALNQEMLKRVKTQLATKEKEIRDKVQGEFAQKLAEKLKAERAKIADQTAKDVAKLNTAATTLNDAQKESIKTEAAATVTKKMADYRAGKLKVNLPSAKAIAGAQGADAANGLTEKQRAALEMKVSDLVAKKLPAILESKVDGKMAEATNKAIVAVEAELKKESDTMLETKLSAQPDMSAQDKATLKAEAKKALDAKVKTKIQGQGLIGLKTKLRMDLTAQLKPAVVEDLKSEVMKVELSKAKLVAAQNNGSEELGSALDRAESFPVA